MTGKSFRICTEDIERLVDHDGACIATDRIMVDGCLVGYMYRERPNNAADMGWRFMAGDESDEYMDDANNHGVYAVNTIANYDTDILPFIDTPIGSAFARNAETQKFERVDSPIDPDDYLHPDFPVVTGRYSVTPRWFITLPLKFNRRIEEGSLILWCPGVTLYFSAWNNDDNASIATRLAQLKTESSPDAFDLQEHQVGAVQKFSYRLIENGIHALYGFAIAHSGDLQVAVYFDHEVDIDLARSIFAGIAENAA